ncbi:MAG: 3' terminal RNA ribose 2'-O-methyltransferase Hen1, partial [Gammaproteobacteria bacterium]|nr:3' terminal RNA ribose 2'-O-methyltransferase Hen1 [Gammaproteobacteria bacterium]
IPVLDNRKHYWVGDAEVDKLISRGEGWLDAHPLRDMIVRRYLKHQSDLAGEAIVRLSDGEGVEQGTVQEDATEHFLPLNDIRIAAVVRVLKECGANRLLDIGCGEGRLLKELLAVPQFHEIVGVDVSVNALELAGRRLRLNRLPDLKRCRIRLLHGAMTYRDARLEGYDAAAIVEAVEHLDPGQLTTFERAIFEYAKPETVVVTTPNREYNVNYPNIAQGEFRHRDHRFEWTRTEFTAWADKVTEAHGYSVTIEPVGEVDPVLGPPTQMGIFHRCK